MAKRTVLLSLAALLIVSGVAPAAAPTLAASAKGKGIRIFDGAEKVLVVNGYSTSFLWPLMLQRKLDRYFAGKRVLQIRDATKAGTPIAKWIDVSTGRPLPAWNTVRKALSGAPKNVPRIVLAQQSLQWAFGERKVGITGPEDAERIGRGADVLAKYAGQLRKDGATLVFIATHIYKHPMEPAIGHERLALAELLRREGHGVLAGPDLWEPTRKLYPKAFDGDKVHPNSIGSEVMAQKWFECLLAHDGLKVPAWSRAEMDKAVASPPRSTRMLQRKLRRQLNRPGVLLGSVKVYRDIEYAEVDGRSLLLDVFVPAKLTGPLPTVVFIHGGGWSGGDKRGCPALVMLRRGYVVASVNYRLSGVARFPAQIHDCKAALRFLRGNAAKYKINPARVGVWGISAGGHLVALLGTSGGVKEVEGDLGYPEQSSRAQAVVDWCGPTDLVKLWAAKDPGAAPERVRQQNPVSRLLGGPVDRKRQLADMANPVRYVTKDDPPFLIVHGDQDPLVPLSQSQLLAGALKNKAVAVTLYVVKGGGHGLASPATTAMVAAFFDKQLKK